MTTRQRFAQHRWRKTRRLPEAFRSDPSAAQMFLCCKATTNMCLHIQAQFDREETGAHSAQQQQQHLHHLQPNHARVRRLVYILLLEVLSQGVYKERERNPAAGSAGVVLSSIIHTWTPAGCLMCSQPSLLRLSLKTVSSYRPSLFLMLTDLK